MNIPYRHRDVWRSDSPHIAFLSKNRLFSLAATSVKWNKVLQQKQHVQIANKPRSPQSEESRYLDTQPLFILHSIYLLISLFRVQGLGIFWPRAHVTFSSTFFKEIFHRRKKEREGHKEHQIIITWLCTCISWWNLGGGEMSWWECYAYRKLHWAWGIYFPLWPQRIHTEWQWPLSGAHSIMMEKSAPPGEGGGVHSTPSTLSLYCIFHHVQSCGVCSCSWEVRYTPPIFTLPLYVLCVCDDTVLKWVFNFVNQRSLHLDFPFLYTILLLNYFLSILRMWRRLTHAEYMAQEDE